MSNIFGQLEDTRRLADSEARDRATLLGKFRSLEADLERLKEKIEAENEAKADIQKAMSKALAETQIWKAKFNTEALARIEDLENARGKLLVSLLLKANITFFSISNGIQFFGCFFYSICNRIFPPFKSQSRCLLLYKIRPESTKQRIA